MFWDTTNLKQIHIELTNACNAACPQCVRFYKNSPLSRPDLDINQITIEKFKKYFPPHIIQQCELIMFCGVTGDPCVARDLLEICEYIDKVSTNTAVMVTTNGGMRRSDWWTKLGNLFAKHNKHDPNKNIKTQTWMITFSIDGLEDTNHIYRRNVNWKILMENVKAYTDTGAHASWDFLIFKHNEHQINQALELSKTLGFLFFVPKKALGFDYNNMSKHMPVLSKLGKLEYYIEAPTNPKNRNLENPSGHIDPEFLKFDFDPNEYKRLKENKNAVLEYNILYNSIYETVINNKSFTIEDDCKINCKSKRSDGTKEIFVDAFGRVIPCCHLGLTLNSMLTDPSSLQLHKHVNDYGWEKFSLEQHSLEEILSQGHLDKVYADSWNRKSIKDGRLKHCADTCGQLSAVDKIYTHELDTRNES